MASGTRKAMKRSHTITRPEDEAVGVEITTSRDEEGKVRKIEIVPGAASEVLDVSSEEDDFSIANLTQKLPKPQKLFDYTETPKKSEYDDIPPAPKKINRGVPVKDYFAQQQIHKYKLLYTKNLQEKVEYESQARKDRRENLDLKFQLHNMRLKYATLERKFESTVREEKKYFNKWLASLGNQDEVERELRDSERRAVNEVICLKNQIEILKDGKADLERKLASLDEDFTAEMQNQDMMKKNEAIFCHTIYRIMRFLNQTCKREGEEEYMIDEFICDCNDRKEVCKRGTVELDGVKCTLDSSKLGSYFSPYIKFESDGEIDDQDFDPEEEDDDDDTVSINSNEDGKDLYCHEDMEDNDSQENA